MVLTVSFVLSPVTGLVATVACGRFPFHRLDASVGASGPHDFAVREICALVRSAIRVHRIPPRVRDDREPPLQWGRDGNGYRVIWGIRKTRIFLQKGLDNQSKLDS
jgi:hypothetical protein